MHTSASTRGGHGCSAGQGQAPCGPPSSSRHSYHSCLPDCAKTVSGAFFCHSHAPPRHSRAGGNPAYKARASRSFRRSEGKADGQRFALSPAGAIARMCAFRALFALDSRLRGNGGYLPCQWVVFRAALDFRGFCTACCAGMTRGEAKDDKGGARRRTGVSGGRAKKEGAQGALQKEKGKPASTRGRSCPRRRRPPLAWRRRTTRAPPWCTRPSP